MPDEWDNFTNVSDAEFSWNHFLYLELKQIIAFTQMSLLIQEISWFTQETNVKMMLFFVICFIFYPISGGKKAT